MLDKVRDMILACSIKKLRLLKTNSSIEGVLVMPCHKMRERLIIKLKNKNVNFRHNIWLNDSRPKKSPQKKHFKISPHRWQRYKGMESEYIISYVPVFNLNYK